MSIGQGDFSESPREAVSSMAQGDDGVLIPGSAPPLGTGRTDVNPSDEAGVDELPNNDGEIPRDHDQAGMPEGIPDIDPDNAELDDVPNPR